MIVHFSIVILIVLDQFEHSTQQENCPTSIKQINNQLLLLSDNQVDGNRVNNFCSSAGGELFQISSNETRQQLDSYLRSKLISSDLATVTIRQNPNHVNIFKYRSSSGNVDRQNIDDWLIPPEGRLRSILMYSRRTASFYVRTSFCYFTDRDEIRATCNQGWFFNFRLYGGTKFTPQAIPLYKYFNNVDGLYATSLFLNDNVVLLNQVKGTNPYAVYIPDISVFVGARSNQTNWVWNNGTMVTDQRFPEANASYCQEMTWPLTYDDGINLRPKSCGNEAYVLCKFDFSIRISAVECNGKVLNVFWHLTRLEEIANEASKLMVQLQINNGSDVLVTVPLSKQWTIVDGLKQRTKYNIKATLIYANCTNKNNERRISIAAFASNTTSFGIPQPVDNFILVNSADDASCQIEWKYNATNAQEVVAYQITMKSANKTKQFNISNENLTFLSDSAYRYDVKSNQVMKEEIIELQIRVYSCEGGSKIVKVRGTCFQSASPPAMIIGVICGAAALVLCLILIVGYVLHKKRSNERSAGILNGNVDSSYTRLHNNELQENDLHVPKTDIDKQEFTNE